MTTKKTRTITIKLENSKNSEIGVCHMITKVGETPICMIVDTAAAVSCINSEVVEGDPVLSALTKHQSHCTFPPRSRKEDTHMKQMGIIRAPVHVKAYGNKIATFNVNFIIIDQLNVPAIRGLPVL